MLAGTWSRASSARSAPTANPNFAAQALSYTFTAADAGTHTIPAAVFYTTGTYSLSVTSPLLPTATQAITVNPATASHFSVTSPATAVAGTPTTTVAATLDAQQPVEDLHRHDRVLRSGDVQAGLPASYTFTAPTPASTRSAPPEDGGRPDRLRGRYHHRQHRRKPRRDHGQPVDDRGLAERSAGADSWPPHTRSRSRLATRSATWPRATTAPPTSSARTRRRSSRATPRSSTGWPPPRSRRTRSAPRRSRRTMWPRRDLRLRGDHRHRLGRQIHHDSLAGATAGAAESFTVTAIDDIDDISTVYTGGVPVGTSDPRVGSFYYFHRGRRRGAYLQRRAQDRRVAGGERDRHPEPDGHRRPDRHPGRAPAGAASIWSRPDRHSGRGNQSFDVSARHAFNNVATSYAGARGLHHDRTPRPSCPS